MGFIALVKVWRMQLRTLVSTSHIPPYSHFLKNLRLQTSRRLKSTPPAKQFSPGDLSLVQNLGWVTVLLDLFGEIRFVLDHPSFLRPLA